VTAFCRRGAKEQPRAAFVTSLYQAQRYSIEFIVMDEATRRARLVQGITP